MSSINQVESLMTDRMAEILKIADTIKEKFDTVRDLALQMLTKLDEFNEEYNRQLFSMVDEKKCDEIVAANKRLHSMVQRTFENEVELRMKIVKILEMTSDPTEPDSANYDTASIEAQCSP